jgi:cell wall-associated NlpC family hydrolase/outer membrane murein-binding lipoprotein Lpp
VQTIRTVRRRPGVLVALAAAAVVAGLVVAPGVAHAAPPPNPSDHQLTAAQQHKNNLAGAVGRLSAQTARLQSRLDQLEAAKELAEQKMAYAQSKLVEAKSGAEQAKANVAGAQARVVQAQRDFVGYLQASYMSGEVTGTTGSLLTAHDPNVLLEEGALHDYQSSHQLSAIGNMQRATVAKSNADAAARKALSVQAAAAKAAKQATAQAVAAVDAAQRQQKQLQLTLATNQARLHSAQLQLATLNNERAKFIAYQQEQARIAAARAEAERRARAEAEAAAQARGAANSSGGSYVSPGPLGNWTPRAGRRAVERAMQLLGTPYSWAAGNASGPTYGLCFGGIHSNACNVLGVDCSGLVMFAWAQYPFVHYAATQYLQGSVHPNTSSLMPGDLVFWSSDGTVAGIHHVAIYIGGGDIIQAPQTGDVVRITPLSEKTWGYYGATRPLT